MDTAQRLVLPADVELVPVRALDDATRTRFTHRESDYLVSRARSRSTSHVIDAAAATLVESFRTPHTVVDAVIAYGRSTGCDPEHALVDAWPMLRRLVDVGFLVPEDAPPLIPMLALGARVGPWTVVACIQLLTDTEVYQVRDDAGQFFALKIAPQPEREHEAAMLAHLGTLVAHEPYLVTDWFDGIDAERTAAEIRSDRPALIALARSILGAYAALHARGVVHGDVHPRNVLIDAAGRVRLIDFAYARRLDSEQPAPPRAGIAFYSEPECTAEATVAGEQYALGALLYYLITGAHYCNFPLERAAFHRAIRETPPLAFVEPWPEMEAVLRRALAKTPEARWASVAEMASALPSPEKTAPPPATTGALARAMLSDVIARAESDPPYATAPTASVVSGMAGLALMLYRASVLRESASLLALADRWVTRAAAAIPAPTAFDSENARLSELRGHVSPYHTASGVHCVQALIANAAGDRVSLADAVAAFIATTSAPCASAEVMFGSAGVLIATSLLVEAMAGVHHVDQLVAHGNHIVDAMPDCGEIAWTGAAHGWTGVLYASLRWCKAAGRDVPHTVVARLDELASYGEPWGRGLRWPQSIDPATPERHRYLSGWCNGTAGLVHLWTLAGRDDLAERAAWHVWEHPPEGLGSLCCGMAGAAYALLLRANKDRQWRYRAIQLADRAARSIVRESDTRDGLWYGEPGVALLAVDLESGGPGCMPLFSAEGWSAR
jgi:eukaryotic-like serine/threonine-protein kinase